MTFTVILLLVVIYKMIQIRERRLQADEWLTQNQRKLINYAFTKQEELDKVAEVLEQSKMHAEVTTGKSNIRQGVLDKIVSRQKSYADMQQMYDEDDQESDDDLKAETADLRQRSRSYAPLSPNSRIGGLE